ncbi:MAG: metalloregulator ArsR/SmtB family transcription factor [Pseudomonadota bacterium]
MNFDSYTQALKAAAEPTRLRLLVLCARGELSVSDLVAVLGQSQPRVSRHLKVLCDAGLLERYRDGHWVLFRVPLVGSGADLVHRLLDPLDSNDPQLAPDKRRLEALLGEQQPAAVDPMLRRFNRLLLSYFLTQPVGELLDVGVGSGAVLKLLAQRATQAVGIDVDLASRQAARRELLRNGLQHCSIRSGDMHALEFDDDTFDTVILDEVLMQSDQPANVLREAMRVLRGSGRLLIVEHQAREQVASAIDLIKTLAQNVELPIGSFRRSADNHLEYLVAEGLRGSAQRDRRPA